MNLLINRSALSAAHLYDLSFSLLGLQDGICLFCDKGSTSSRILRASKKNSECNVFSDKRNVTVRKMKYQALKKKF